MRILLFILFPFLLSAQSKTQPARSKGEVFKHRPEKPYENVNNTGLVVVTKGMYGLTFEDKQLSAETKKRVESFFKLRLNGYTDLKTYHLKIRKRQNKWYIGTTEF
ncbi:hypothetical protein [Amniculibacterium sp. G2-70]|uniref:hypothetical protein n=1 Tax=Amniculibacterium sp. G2-70 TaxID=2767188 RepID=UPI00165456D7|nr:hypothetical protein [Amniculibacterium sp. G2-70]